MEDDDMNQYKKLFEPITIKNMTLDNRLVMTPMGTNFGEQNGEMSFYIWIIMKDVLKEAMVF